MESQYTAVVVGTGFASSFFLSAFLGTAGPDARVLVLERGRRETHAWQVQNRRTSSTDPDATFVNRHPTKRWIYNPAFGGGSNCWWAATPRFMPSDFRLRSLYGVGRDWPLDYAELEPWYERVEALMSVSGGDAPYPRRAACPQPPHRMTAPDEVLREAFPGAFFHQPTARARQATARRPACCASGVCNLCPVRAKFTIDADMGHIYEDPRVTLLLGATAERVDVEGGEARGVEFSLEGRVSRAGADLVVLGASALFNPHLLSRSGIEHPLLGRRLHEQVSIRAQIDLDGLDNFQGSTSITGHGYMFYDGPHRSERAACLVETLNIPDLRPERGRWRQRLAVKLVFEDLPVDENRVVESEANPALPETLYRGHSDYTQRGLDAVPRLLEELIAPLPVESFEVAPRISKSEAHILGTTVMGDDPDTSVIDPYSLHHRHRNLLVLGSGAFPTCSPANPTLTLSALALRSAFHLNGVRTG